MRIVGSDQPDRSSPIGGRVSPRLAVAAFASLPSEAVVLDHEGVVVLANEAWRQFGYDNGGGSLCGVGSSYLQVCREAARSGDDQAAVVVAALQAVLDGNAPRAELDYACHSPAEQRWFRLRATRLPGRQHVLVVHDDITDHVERQVRLEHVATHDPLTGLPNRALLDERLGAALSTAELRRRPSLAVFMVNLDGFKAVNDRDGHQAGDAVLAACARRLKSIGRVGDTVARWGGDGFVLVLPGCSKDAAERVRERVAGAIAEPVALGALRVHVTACVGVAVGEPADDLQALMTRAKDALRAVKAARSSPSVGSRGDGRAPMSAGGTS